MMRITLLIAFATALGCAGPPAQSVAAPHAFPTADIDAGPDVATGTPAYASDDRLAVTCEGGGVDAVVTLSVNGVETPVPYDEKRSQLAFDDGVAEAAVSLVGEDSTSASWKTKARCGEDVDVGDGKALAMAKYVISSVIRCDGQLAALTWAPALTFRTNVEIPHQLAGARTRAIVNNKGTLDIECSATIGGVTESAEVAPGAIWMSPFLNVLPGVYSATVACVFPSARCAAGSGSGGVFGKEKIDLTVGVIAVEKPNAE